MQLHDLLDELSGRLGIDPGRGVQLARAAELVRIPVDPGLPLLIIPAADEPTAGAGTTLPGRWVSGGEPAGLLRSLYPADHPVLGLAGRADTTVAALDDSTLAAGASFVPALAGEANSASPHSLPWLVARLRAPDGCPWDREQDHLSLRKFLLEEAYEVYDALEAGSTPQLAEELGDLLLQIVLHAHYAAEAGVFDLADVYRAVMAKIVRRHPHVFGDVVAESAAEVIRNWEQIKAGERAARSAAGGLSEASKGPGGTMPAAFAGLSRSLPALAYAQEMQERAASLGYDWPSVEGVLDKVAEEASEIARAGDEKARREEFGDLLLVMVNLGRRLGIDAEASLRQASAKFAARFAQVERAAADRDVELRSLSMAELDELWQLAKAGSRAPGGGLR